MGLGEGLGRGRGRGQGQGDQNPYLGASFAVGCTVLFCVCGMPMVLAGIVLIASQVAVSAGIILVTLSGIQLLVALILVILICTGKMERGNRVHTAQSVGVITSTSNPNGYQSHYPTNMPRPPPYKQDGPPPYSQVPMRPDAPPGPPSAHQSPPNYSDYNLPPPPQPVYPPPSSQRY